MIKDILICFPWLISYKFYLIENGTKTISSLQNNMKTTMKTTFPLGAITSSTHTHTSTHELFPLVFYEVIRR